MKALYSPAPILCVIIEDQGDYVILEPVDGGEEARFSVPLADPTLILDPSDEELEEAGFL